MITLEDLKAIALDEVEGSQQGGDDAAAGAGGAEGGGSGAEGGARVGDAFMHSVRSLMGESREERC
eukprot:1697036-Rhodomonas_salina.1